MCRTVNINDEIIVVSEGKKDIGKFAILGNDGKFDPSVIPVIDELQDQINKEVAERIEGDKALQTNIDAEASTRTTADRDLQDQITAEIAARTNGDETESSTRSSGDKALQDQIDALKKTVIPSGVIVAWSGSIVSIPSGWNLCDGSNGTPNLCDKFVLGAGSRFAAGTTGGEETHALTIDEMPKHEHTHLQSEFNSGGFDASNDNGNEGTCGASLRISLGDNPSYEGIEKQNRLSSSGNSAPHNNMPPYYALAYIMKMA